MINSWSGVSVIHKESRGLIQNWFLGGAVQKDWVFGLVFGMSMKIEFFLILFFLDSGLLFSNILFLEKEILDDRYQTFNTIFFGQKDRQSESLLMSLSDSF
jgi:hypothetical protein